MTANLLPDRLRERVLFDRLLELARETVRPARGHLRFPYLAPGGTYNEQLWDWDTFWVTKGILQMVKDPATAEGKLFLEHARGSWINFFDHQGDNGTVPILIMPDVRDFFGCVEVPSIESNQAKPVLAQLACEISRAGGSFEWIRPHYSGLTRLLERWRLHYGVECGLLVWGSDAGIGADNDPTTFGRPGFSSANLLLNTLYFEDLHAAAQVGLALGLKEKAEALLEEAKALRQAIRQECWDPVDKFFYTVDVQCRDHRDELIPKNCAKGMDMQWRTMPLKIKMFTGFLPMWCGIATEVEAEFLVKNHLRNPEEFQADWGVPTLARNERMYAPAVNSSNPSNWQGPIWIVVNYMIYVGLLKYGYKEDAAELARKTIELLARDLELTGTLHECYHPDTGAPNFNAGFLSWNLLVGGMGFSEQ